LEDLATRPSSLIDTRIVYCGDCLEQLHKLPDGCIDLIYIDPPFNSNRDFELLWSETGEMRAFEDHHESTAAYIAYMRPRCVELKRVLKKTGSFYYHCDWHASHYVKVMLDQIFGENCFQSEIVWRRTFAKGLAFTGFPNNHDTIFLYGGGGVLTWNRPYMSFDPNNLDAKTAARFSHRDPDGRRYQLDSLINPNPKRRKYKFLGIEKVWRWKETRMQAAYEAGIVVQSKPGSIPRQKRYLDQQKGRSIDTLWTDIPPLNSQARERLGYPTQKPLALLDRIIKASSNENDIILDAFCGCGTALEAAQILGRQWIGIDVSPTACRVMAKRLRDQCGLKEDDKLRRLGRGFVVRDLPWTEDKLRKLPPFEFENWAVIALGGVTNAVQVNDYGIDGRIYPVAAMPATSNANQEFAFMDQWYPIQVKQRDKAGRPDIFQFEAAMMKEKRTKGFFVSFDFTSGAMTEIRRFKRDTSNVIVPLTVRDILANQIEQRAA